jgi:tRNA nucleotidyltransferase (CCA-adding enzyme)
VEKPSNLKDRLESHLSAKQMAFIKKAVTVASKSSVSLYLVGGAVRDLLLNLPIRDLDLVVEGEANILAGKLAKAISGKVISHSQFNTAKLVFHDGEIDLVSARSEIYPSSGELPVVKLGSIQDDLLRRDFTINAMAVRLSPGQFGTLLDPCNGQQDLRMKLIRAIHDDSFRDDATRIIRAIRYEQRLEFNLEDTTAKLLNRDISMLCSIRGHRIRRALEETFMEKQPWLTLERLTNLGALKSIFIHLNGIIDPNTELSALRQSIRNLSDLHYLAWLAYRLNVGQDEQFITRLNMSKSWANVVRGIGCVRKVIANRKVIHSPVSTYRELKDHTLEAIEVATALQPKHSYENKVMDRYLNEWRNLRPILTAHRLIQLGIPKGPELGKVRQELIERHLREGTVTLKDEKAVVAQAIENLKQKPSSL